MDEVAADKDEAIARLSRNVLLFDTRIPNKLFSFRGQVAFTIEQQLAFVFVTSRPNDKLRRRATDHNLIRPFPFRVPM